MVLHCQRKWHSGVTLKQTQMAQVNCVSRWLLLPPLPQSLPMVSQGITYVHWLMVPIDLVPRWLSSSAGRNQKWVLQGCSFTQGQSRGWGKVPWAVPVKKSHFPWEVCFLQRTHNGHLATGASSCHRVKGNKEEEGAHVGWGCWAWLWRGRKASVTQRGTEGIWNLGESSGHLLEPSQHVVKPDGRPQPPRVTGRAKTQNLRKEGSPFLGTPTR